MDAASLASASVIFVADLGAAFAKIFPFDLARYLFAAGGVFLTVNLVFSSAFAARKIRRNSPEPSQMRREFAASMRTTAIFAMTGALTLLGAEAGIFPNYDDPGERGWAYFAFTVIALIVAHDAWFYWTHRAIHHPRLFRRVHGLHHRSKNPSPWTSYSFNVGEALVNVAYLPIFLFFVPTSTLAVVVFLTHMIIRNAIGHCGYELFPAHRDGRPVFDWLTTVTHHDIHHAEAGWNFGLYFTFWDRLVGTEHPLYHERFAAAVGAPLDGSAVRAMGLHPLNGGKLR